MNETKTKWHILPEDPPKNDKEVLLASGRGHTIEDVINASHLIKKYNFPPIRTHQLNHKP